MIRVYLVDDHEVVRRGLRDLLVVEGDIRIVGGVASAAEATQHIPTVRPDVMVLDVRLPDGSGIDVCRAVRSIDPTIRALMLTSFDDDEALLAAVMAGAAGYTLKQLRGSDVVHALRRVAAGQSLLDPAATARLRRRLTPDVAAPDEELGALTDWERRVLMLIIEGRTDGEIAEQTAVAEPTVRESVAGLLTKLGLAGPTGPTGLARGLLDRR